MNYHPRPRGVKFESQLPPSSYMTQIKHWATLIKPSFDKYSQIIEFVGMDSIKFHNKHTELDPNTVPECYAYVFRRLRQTRRTRADCHLVNA